MYTSFKKWATQYAKRHDLEFRELNGVGYRLKNKAGQYVDCWKNGSYRSIDGEFFRVGSTQRGWGCDELYDYEQAPIEEIKKLVIQHHEKTKAY